MAPEVALTAAATPLPPLAACAVFGKETVEALPSFQAPPAAFTRYSEKFCVVPEESERTVGVIVVLGRLTPGLSALIAGSLQVVMVPWKMPARTVASSFSPVTPPRL